MLAKLHTLKDEFLVTLQVIKSEEALEELLKNYLGKK